MVHLAVNVFPTCCGWITGTEYQAIRQRIRNKLLEAEQILRAQGSHAFAVLLNKLESGKGEVLWK